MKNYGPCNHRFQWRDGVTVMYFCTTKPKPWVGILSISRIQIVRGSYSKSQVFILTATETKISL